MVAKVLPQSTVQPIGNCGKGGHLGTINKLIIKLNNMIMTCYHLLYDTTATISTAPQGSGPVYLLPSQGR